MTPEHKKWLWWGVGTLGAIVVLWWILRSTGGSSSPSLNVANVGGGGSVGSLGGMGSLGVSGVVFAPGGGLSVSTSAPANSGAAVTGHTGDTGTSVTGAGSTGNSTTVAKAPPVAYQPPPGPNPVVQAIINKSPGGPIGPTKPTGGKGTQLQ